VVFARTIGPSAAEHTEDLADESPASAAARARVLRNGGSGLGGRQTMGDRSGWAAHGLRAGGRGQQRAAPRPGGRWRINGPHFSSVGLLPAQLLQAANLLAKQLSQPGLRPRRIVHTADRAIAKGLPRQTIAPRAARFSRHRRSPPQLSRLRPSYPVSAQAGLPGSRGALLATRGDAVAAARRSTRFRGGTTIVTPLLRQGGEGHVGQNRGGRHRDPLQWVG